jgi:DNA-binding MarR family transcriptional regulator
MPDAIRQPETVRDPAVADGAGLPCPLATACRPSHPAVAAWVHLRSVAARTERRLDAALRRHGLNRAQFAALLHIGAGEGRTQQDLADGLGLTKANMSQLLFRLEAAGLVKRVPASRAYALHLTDDSRILLAAVIPEQEAIVAALFADLSPAEQEQFRALVERLGPAGCGD